MALPSSPPMLPESALPDSPPLLPTVALGVSGGTFDRKRPRSEYGSMSSDPIFSDTNSDQDESTNLDQPKRKRLVRGPWWNVARHGRKDLRRSITRKESLRNADSGVWMGSDSSDGSIDSIVSSQQRMQELVVNELVTSTRPKNTAAVGEEEPPLHGEALVSRIVQRCVDDGVETVDLSAMGITTLSDETLKPLRHLIRQTFAEFTHPPSEDEFTPLTPDLKLFLSRNQLSSLSPELFNLTNLSVLSLRSNELYELPPAIARLHNLEELNIAGNNIRYLPWELLGMIHRRGKHRQITLRPNPLVTPADFNTPSPLLEADVDTHVADGNINRQHRARQSYEMLRLKYDEMGILNIRYELELRLQLARFLRTQHLEEQSPGDKDITICKEELHGELTPCQQELFYLASSKIHYFGVDGRPRRSGTRVSPLERDYTPALEPIPHTPDLAASRGGIGTSSLFELALRGIQSNYNLQDLVPQLDGSDLSPGLTSAIRTAAGNVVGHGNESCSTCGRRFVVARAEWMEYWFNGLSARTALSADTVLPFLRRVCNWNCARTSQVGDFKA